MCQTFYVFKIACIKKTNYSGRDTTSSIQHKPDKPKCFVLDYNSEPA